MLSINGVYNITAIQLSLSLGAIFLNTIMSFAFVWLFHCGTFFWGVVWPYHYSISRSLGRTKYYHISAIVISVLLPLIAVTAMYTSDGISLTLMLIPMCGPGSPEVIFYGFIAPLSLVAMAGVVLLILTFWSIADIVSDIIL